MTILSFLLSVINLGKIITKWRVLVNAHSVRKYLQGLDAFFKKINVPKNKSMWFTYVLNNMWVFKLFYFDFYNTVFVTERRISLFQACEHETMDHGIEHRPPYIWILILSAILNYFKLNWRSIIWKKFSSEKTSITSKRFRSFCLTR